MRYQRTTSQIDTMSEDDTHFETTLKNGLEKMTENLFLFSQTISMAKSHIDTLEYMLGPFEYDLNHDKELSEADTQYLSEQRKLIHFWKNMIDTTNNLSNSCHGVNMIDKGVIEAYEKRYSDWKSEHSEETSDPVKRKIEDWKEDIMKERKKAKQESIDHKLELLE